jgi:MarR-like DNA-binding transcriptional regulator SgrR of sgrS sRNA
MARPPARTPRQVKGERWSIHADEARAMLTAAEWHAAAGRHRRAALCFACTQDRLAEAENDCAARAEAELIAGATKKRGGRV